MVSRVFGEVETAMPFVVQLAYENANKFCQEAIRPWKNKRDLSIYIKLCKDINEAVITGNIIAAAMRGVSPLNNSGGVRPKGCFLCGQPGHMKRQCPNKGQGAAIYKPKAPQPPSKEPIPKALNVSSNGTAAVVIHQDTIIQITSKKSAQFLEMDSCHSPCEV